jgi:hypothetical protein
MQVPPPDVVRVSETIVGTIAIPELFVRLTRFPAESVTLMINAGVVTPPT